MQTLSDNHLTNGEPKASSSWETAQASLANASLDAIEALPEKIMALIKEVSAMPGARVPVKDMEEYSSIIRENLEEMFCGARYELMEVAGWRPKYTRNPDAVKSASEILLDAVKPRGTHA